jgi:hypothetical protein
MGRHIIVANIVNQLFVRLLTEKSAGSKRGNNGPVI